jgi:hypothetical protein
MRTIEFRPADFARRAGPPILFEEDFDLPAPALGELPQPELIEPMFSAAELREASEQAAQEADRRVRAELAADHAAAVGAALAAIADQLGQAAVAAHSAAEAAAEAVAQTVMAGFAAAFPALSRRHGEVELRAVLRDIIPALDSEPRVTIRVAPQLVGAVRDELVQLDGDLVERVQVVPMEAMPVGDVRVQWQAGHATRDAARLWQEIEAILAPAGLLPAPAAPRHLVARETADAE